LILSGELEIFDF